MSDQQTKKNGSIVWTDLTVNDAEKVKDFYSSVVGWESTEHDMGEYKDFNIFPSGGGETVAGICHARGSNANIPPQWLIYVQVQNVAKSAQRCLELGGKIIDGPRKMGNNDFCVIQDPEDAMLALIG